MDCPLSPCFTSAGWLLPFPTRLLSGASKSCCVQWARGCQVLPSLCCTRIRHVFSNDVLHWFVFLGEQCYLTYSADWTSCQARFLAKIFVPTLRWHNWMSNPWLTAESVCWCSVLFKCCWPVGHPAYWLQSVIHSWRISKYNSTEDCVALIVFLHSLAPSSY